MSKNEEGIEKQIQKTDMRTRYEKQRWMDRQTKRATNKKENKAFDSHQSAIKTHQKLERGVDGRACINNGKFQLSLFANGI